MSNVNLMANGHRRAMSRSMTMRNEVVKLTVEEAVEIGASNIGGGEVWHQRHGDGDNMAK